MASKYSMNDRPSWPRRAIVTAGEPYGNKGLHFGHVGGVFVPADFFAEPSTMRPSPRTHSRNFETVTLSSFPFSSTNPYSTSMSTRADSARPSATSAE